MRCITKQLQQPGTKPAVRCSAVLAVWALEIASTLSTRSLELSFAAALSGARGHLNPEGRELEGVLQVVPALR